MKKITAIILVLVMIFSLAACGKKTDKPAGQQPAAAAAAEEKPEYTYLTEVTEIKTGDGISFSVDAFDDTGFYSSSYVKIGENIPEGAVPEYEGQYDVYGYKLYHIGFDGKVNELENYTDIDFNAENADGVDTSISRLLINPDGTLTALGQVSVSYYSGPADVEQYSDEWYRYYNYESHYFVRTMDNTGKELSLSYLDFDDTESWLDMYSVYIGDDGTIYIPVANQLYMFAADGSVKGVIDVDNAPDTYVEGICKLSDGSLGVMTYSWVGETGTNTLGIVDLENCNVKEKIKLDFWPGNVKPGDANYDFYYSEGSYLYGYSAKTNTRTKILSWIDCDVNGSNVIGYKFDDDGNGKVISTITGSNWETLGIEVASLTKVPYEQVPQKTVLTLAALYSNYRTTEAVLKFNRASKDCRITIKDYSQYNTDENYNLGQEKLLTEIMSGSVPDLIDCTSMPVSSLAAKDYFEDLYPFLNADNELKDAVMPNVLKGLENNGKLIAVTDGFYIQTLVGSEDIVGDGSSWTYNDFNNSLAYLREVADPDAFALSEYTTSGDLLINCLSLDIDRYINWETGETHFDSREFVDLLNFCSQFPREFDWDNYEWEENSDDYSRLMQGSQMLVSYYFSNFNDFATISTILKDKPSFVGYPSSDGTGNGTFLGINNKVSMMSACKDKDAAWQFLRYFFTKDGESTGDGCFPANKNLFNEMLKKAKEQEYQKDANGNFILDENGNKIPVYTPSWIVGTQDMKIGALTDAQAEMALELINSCTRTNDYDYSMTDMITEETNRFFLGGATAEQTAKALQSKMNIYINEKR